MSGGQPPDKRFVNVSFFKTPHCIACQASTDGVADPITNGQPASPESIIATCLA